MCDLSLKTKMIADALERMFGRPQWEGEGNALESLIRTVLSQNTNDINRDRAYCALRDRFPTWEDVLEADAQEIADVIKVGGLANQKSVRIVEILTWIKETYGKLNIDFVCGMETDKAIDLFCSRKGIGPKTVGVMLMSGCGTDIFPIDTHIHRITRRLGLVPQHCTAERAYDLMSELVPDGRSYSLHTNMIRFGRNVCHARNPECEGCPLYDDCVWVKENRS